MSVEIDREAAAVYGISVDQVRPGTVQRVWYAPGRNDYTPSNDYQVILESLPEFQADPSGLSKIFVKTNVAGSATGIGSSATGGSPGAGVTGNGVPSGTASRCPR